MKYVLDYIKEEMFIVPAANSNVSFEEEFAEDHVPIGYRIIINNKDINLVVWYADYNKWLEKKYENLLLKN